MFPINADSNPESLSCVALRALRPSIECCSDDTEFCPTQCSQGVCRCVDPDTGEVIGSGVFFNEDDPNIDCDTGIAICIYIYIYVSVLAR